MSLEPVNNSIQPARGGALVVRGARSIKLLTEPVLFDEEALPGFVRSALLTVGALAVALLVWSSFVHIDEVAIATGEVLPTGQIQQVQVLDGGTVAEILVKEDDPVRKGQVLARMDPTQALIDLAQLQAHYVDLELRQERLRAETQNRPPNFEAIGAAYPDKVAGEQRLYLSQIAENRSALAVIDAQLDQRQHEIAQLQDQLVTARQQLANTDQQVAIRDQGVQAGVVSREIYLATKRSQVVAAGEIDRVLKQIQLEQSTLSEYYGHRRNLAQTQQQNELAELGTIGDEAGQMKDAIAKAQDRVDRLELRAPSDGTVQDLRVHTVGEAVPAGAQVMSVVPSEQLLVADVRISPSDIGQIAVGQHVKIKVASYDYSRFGMVAGTISKLSPSTLTDSQGAPYYLGEVLISQPYIGNDPTKNPLLPGMGVEADIKTGQRTLIQFLARPFVSSVSDAFHER